MTSRLASRRRPWWGVDWWDAAASLVLGATCVGCGAPGRPWCSDCDEDLRAAVDPVLVGEDPPVVACCRYGALVPDAVVGFKDRGVSALRATLGQILAAGVLHLFEAGAAGGVLVPVPSSPAAVRRRGFDHMWQISQVAAETLELSALRLVGSRRRRDQAGLGASARQRNVAGSMHVTAPGTGAVVAVDDVRTSGATLAECERALGAGGYRVIGHVVIASAI